VFAVSGSTVDAYNQTTGALAWQTTLNGTIFHLVAAAGVLYATTPTTVYALVAATGKQDWLAGCTEGESNPSAPAIVDTRVIYTCYDSSDATIEELETLPAPQHGVQLDWANFIPSTYQGELAETLTTDATVEVSGGLAVTETAFGTQQAGNDGGTQGSGFAAFKVSNGTLLWNDGITVGVTGYPALANRDAYYTTNDAITGAASLDTGATTWSNDIGSETDAPALANGLLYVSDDPNTLVLRASDGTQLASLPASENGSAAPVVVDGAVFLVDGGGSGSAILERWTLNGAATPAAVHRPRPAALRPDRSLRLR
jgi:outer membrane protein assembly factor BamB